MKQETIKKAVKVINRSIKSYQKKLTYQLELRIEAKFENGNLEVDDFHPLKNKVLLCKVLGKEQVKIDLLFLLLL